MNIFIVIALDSIYCWIICGEIKDPFNFWQTKASFSLDKVRNPLLDSASIVVLVAHSDYRYQIGWLQNTMKYLDVDLLYAIVCFVSLSGCIWHLSDVSHIYFSYETNVNVNFEREIMVQIPGITICTNSSLTVSEEFFDRKYPFLKKVPDYQNSKYYHYKTLLRNLTLDEQLNQATVDYKQVFNSCLIMKPVAFEDSEGDYIDCDRISPVHQYITYAKKCFSIGLQLGNEQPERFMVDHDTTLRDNGFPLFQLRLNNQYLQEMVVFIHSRSTPFLGLIGGQTNGIHLNNTKYSSYTLSYVKTINELLPPPFKTQCRNYETIGYKTLSHCIISCKANYFIKQFNGWHPDIPANNEYNLNVHYSQIELKENKTLDKLMAEECLKICGKREDCLSEFYSMSVIGQFERSVHLPQYDHLHGIYIYLPSGLNTHYIHSPRLHLIEFICYFASVFSLWFGFSIIALSRAVIKAIHHYRKRNQHPEPRSSSAKDQDDPPFSSLSLST